MKGDGEYMITFTILILLFVGLVIALLVGGAGFVIVFADVFIGAALVYFIIRKFLER